MTFPKPQYITIREPGMYVIISEREYLYLLAEEKKRLAAEKKAAKSQAPAPWPRTPAP
jgi:hypothetical protein